MQNYWKIILLSPVFVQNDPAFLSAIHETYLQILSKDLSNVKL